MKQVIIAGLLIVLSSCKHGQISNVISDNGADSVLNDSLSQVSDDAYEYQDQKELNELHANWMIEYNDSIEKNSKHYNLPYLNTKSISTKRKKHG